MNNKIEIFDEVLIDNHPDLAMEVLAASSRFEIPLGWHYILDLIWVLKEIQEFQADAASAPTLKILDLGAGIGLLQFMLAEAGYQVISLDMMPRIIPVKLEYCFNFKELESQINSPNSYSQHLDQQSGHTRLLRLLIAKVRNLKSQRGRSKVKDMMSTERKRAIPTITLYSCDATNMADLPDNSIDICASISALEHNVPANVTAIQSEVSRVVKTGGICLHTTSCQKSGTSFHDASHSYLLDETELAKIYGIKEHESNWADWNDLEKALRESERLPRWISNIYYQSANNGMPLGKWDPEYMPVGIRIRN